MRGLAVGVSAAAFLVGGCGGSDESGEGSAEPTTEAAEETRCVDVPPAVVDGIETGLTVTGGGTLRNAQAVKSKDFRNVWFVSADIQGDGLEDNDQIATWALSGEQLGSGLILSVDGFANEFSDWGDGRKTDAQFALSDDGIEESRDCAEALGG